jgi:hypothetical protein
MTHEIKCWPQYFCRVLDGSKTFEVRVNDRGYQPGDEVVMKEWNPEAHTVDDGITGCFKEPIGYTGRKVKFKVGYVYPMKSGNVVFSILDLRSL